MISIITPAGIRQVADRYKDIFASVGINYSTLVSFFCAHLFGVSTLSALVRLFGFSPSVSTLSDALSKFSCKNRFMRRLRSSILRKYKNPEDWQYLKFAFDSTAKLKRMKGLIGGGHWANSKGNVYEGLTIVVVSLVDIRTGNAIPIAWDRCKKEWEEDHKTGWEIVLDLLDEIIADGFPPLSVVGDSWYDGYEFMEELVKRSMKFCIQLKSERNVKTNPAPNSKWLKLPAVFSEFKKMTVKVSTKIGLSSNKKRRIKTKYICSKIIFIFFKSEKDGKKKTKMMPLKVTAVYNHHREKSAFGYYATNNLSAPDVWSWEMSRFRWNIEVLFRDLKQNFAWCSLPCRSNEGVELAVCLPMALIASLRLDSPDVWGLEQNKEESLGVMLAKIKAKNFDKSLDILIKNPLHAVVSRIKNRRQAERVNKKPVDKPAEVVLV